MFPSKKLNIEGLFSGNPDPDYGAAKLSVMGSWAIFSS